MPGKTNCDSTSTDCFVKNGSFRCGCKEGYRKTAEMQKLNTQYCTGSYILVFYLYRFNQNIKCWYLSHRQAAKGSDKHTHITASKEALLLSDSKYGTR